jgi:hypothetical protein
MVGDQFIQLPHKSKPMYDAPTRGFVQRYDTKPKRHVFNLLKSRGTQENQQVAFLSDEGADTQHLQIYLSPASDHSP